jgi:hypothetical protein
MTVVKGTQVNHGIVVELHRHDIVDFIHKTAQRVEIYTERTSFPPVLGVNGGNK